MLSPAFYLAHNDTIESRASHLLGKCSTAELCPQPFPGLYTCETVLLGLKERQLCYFCVIVAIDTLFSWFLLVSPVSPQDCARVSCEPQLGFVCEAGRDPPLYFSKTGRGIPWLGEESCASKVGTVFIPSPEETAAGRGG